MSHPCVMPTITYATLGAKGQIVIPKEARDKLHIGPGDKVVLMIEDGMMMVINPDGVQHMIRILQEGIKQEITDEKGAITNTGKERKKK